MKKLHYYKLVLLLAIIVFAGCSGNKVTSQVSVSANISYQTFYDDLSPYGTWIDYPAYGHVWHPAIAGDFRPYLTNGYWDYSDEGWMWMSNYNWGWAPFHYGRWVYDDMYGWLWIPGYEWSPAWVTWGMYDDYYAWAPLMPDVNVGIAFGSWRPAAMYWNVCQRGHIYDRNIIGVVEKRNVVVNNINRISIINNFNTTKIHNQYYAKGPDVNEVQRYTNHRIMPATIHEMNKQSVAEHKGNEINVYRPPISHPQPREFRRVDNNNAGPVRNNNDRMETQTEQQRQNIDRLPVRKAPEGTFNPGHSMGNGGGRNHRN